MNARVARAAATCVAACALLGSHGGLQRLALFPIAPAPVSALGLTAGHEFEAWVRFAISPDPRVEGRSFENGAVIAITFPPEFTALEQAPRAYLLRGWPQGDLATERAVTREDAQEARTVAIRLGAPIAAAGADVPGLKAIHLIAGLRNPPAGRYTIHMSVAVKGDVVESGDEQVMIADQPLPSIAAYNAAHGGLDQDYQRVAPGARAAVPYDFIINDRDGGHPAGISLRRTRNPRVIDIKRAGKTIGHLSAERGARIDIAPAQDPQTVRVTAFGPPAPGVAYVHATLEGGAGTVQRLIAE